MHWSVRLRDRASPLDDSPSPEDFEHASKVKYICTCAVILSVQISAEDFYQRTDLAIDTLTNWMARHYWIDENPDTMVITE